MSRKQAFVAAAAGAAVGAIVLWTAQPAPAGLPSVQRLTITIAVGDVEAQPANFAVKPGVPIVVTFRNYTHEFHTFTVPGLGLSVLVRPAKSGAPRLTRVRFTVPEYGVYTWRCVLCASGAHSQMHAMTGRIYAIVGATR